MKKTALITAIIMLIIMIPFAALAEGGLIRSIKLPKSYSVTVTADTGFDTMLQMQPVVKPGNPLNPALDWSSSNEAVAVVNQAGQVFPVSFGSCRIYARAADGTRKYAKTTIYVKQYNAKSVKINEPSQSLQAGATLKLTAQVGPAQAYDKSVTWSSSNKKVAVVNKSGVVTAVSKGSAYIYAKANSGSKKTRARIKVTVTKLPAATVKLNPSNSDGVNYSGNVYDLYTRLGTDQEQAVKTYINSLGKSKGESIVKEAMKYLGTSYDTLDCSQFTRKVYSTFKYNIGNLSDGQAKTCAKYAVNRNKIRPGDLVFFRENDGKKCKCGTATCWRYKQIHHVGIYIGDINGTGYIIDASSVLGKIVVRTWNYGDSFADMTFVMAVHRAK